MLLYDKKNSGRLRAFAMTYLHVQWLDANTFEKLREEFPRAHLLCRFWTMMHAAGNFLVENLRQKRMRPVLLPAADLEARINKRQISVEKTGEKNGEGQELYQLISRYVVQGRYEIVRADEPDAPATQPPASGATSPGGSVASDGEGGRWIRVRVIDRHGDGPERPVVPTAAGRKPPAPITTDAPSSSEMSFLRKAAPMADSPSAALYQIIDRPFQSGSSVDVESAATNLSA